MRAQHLWGYRIVSISYILQCIMPNLLSERDQRQ